MLNGRGSVRVDSYREGVTFSFCEGGLPKEEEEE